ncbi:MAG: folate family ECF transporter S component [Oscillospiraceae bacterium]|nr:folate family ECF transporter S component [Oscillospiraceae bacterium]
MKSFFELFTMSARELTGKNKVRCIAVTAMLIALSMAVEGFTITLPFAKINFAFIALAAIGMLFGPTVAFFAGGMCDVLGYIIHPDGAFLPAYILVAMLQGLIYGIALYPLKENALKNSGAVSPMFAVRAVIGRLVDVLLINLVLNTTLNMHYGFIPKQAFHEAFAARIAKNLIQLCADLPLMWLILPIALKIYFSGRMGRKKADV